MCCDCDQNTSFELLEHVHVPMKYSQEKGAIVAVCSFTQLSSPNQFKSPIKHRHVKTTFINNCNNVHN